MRNAVTLLFVPGSRPERFAKAARAGADVVIVDLEDAVPADVKAAARENLRSAWPIGSSVAVRINGRSSPEFDDDVALCRKLRPAAVILPKTENAQDVEVTAEATGSPVLGLVETARGWSTSARSALHRDSAGWCSAASTWRWTSASRPTRRWTPRAATWSGGRRRAGCPHRSTGSRRQSTTPKRSNGIRAAPRSGGSAESCASTPHSCRSSATPLRPSPEEVALARRVVEADEQALGAAVSLDGAMIDRPVVERARRLLRAAN